MVCPTASDWPSSRVMAMVWPRTTAVYPDRASIWPARSARMPLRASPTPAVWLYVTPSSATLQTSPAAGVLAMVSFVVLAVWMEYEPLSNQYQAEQV